MHPLSHMKIIDVFPKLTPILKGFQFVGLFRSIDPNYSEDNSIHDSLKSKIKGNK